MVVADDEPCAILLGILRTDCAHKLPVDDILASVSGHIFASDKLDSVGGNSNALTDAVC